MTRTSIVSFMTLAALTLTFAIGGGAVSVNAAGTHWSAPTGLHLKSATTSSATLEWDEVPQAPQYRIQLSKKENIAGSVYYRVKDTEKVITGLDKHQVYYAKVKVITLDGGNLSVYSERALKITTGSSTSSATIPKAVQNIKAISTSSTSTNLTWDTVPTATRYRIYWSTSSSMPSSCEPNCKIITPASSGSPSYDLSGLASGRTYYLKISALNAAGKTITSWQSAPTKVKLTSAATIPTTVEGLRTSNISQTNATISWNATPTATRYRVYWSTSAIMSGKCEPTCKIITPPSLTSPMQSLTQIISPVAPAAGGTYYVKISALNAAGKTITSWQPGALKVTLTNPDPGTIPLSVQGLNATDITASDATLSWSKVPTAARYRVYWSTTSSMPGKCEPTCKIITPASSSAPGIKLAALIAPAKPKAGADYYFKVSALNAGGKTITSLQANPQPFTLLNAPDTAPSGLSVTTASATTLSLDWNDVVDAPKYRVQVSTDPSMTDPTYYYFTESQGNLTGLKKSTTYHVKVKVISADGDNISPYTAAVSGKTLAADSVPLEVGSYNVKCQSCYPSSPSDRGPGELPWVDRRAAVVSTIIAQKPDVLGIQEASQAWLIENGKQLNLSQFEDLRNRLEAAGGSYELANDSRNNCVKSTTPTNCQVKDQGASKGTKVFYNSKALALKRQGSQGLERAHKSGQEHFVAWAVFEQKATGQQFFFATTHLEPGSSYGALRQRQVQQVVAAINAANSAKLPVVVTGDMNSTRYATPSNAPYDAFIASGLVDPLGMTYRSPKVSNKATAEKRINANYNSFNGFDPNNRYYAADENGSNLDYIFTSPMQVKEWETVVNLDSSGKLRGLIPSDHNMIRAEVILPH